MLFAHIHRWYTFYIREPLIAQNTPYPNRFVTLFELFHESFWIIQKSMILILVNRQFIEHLIPTPDDCLGIHSPVGSQGRQYNRRIAMTT